jgi:hypothetical protein
MENYGVYFYVESIRSITRASQGYGGVGRLVGLARLRRGLRDEYFSGVFWRVVLNLGLCMRAYE